MVKYLLKCTLEAGVPLLFILGVNISQFIINTIIEFYEE